MTKLERATKFAMDRHRGQKRKDGKTPYWRHLEHVVKRLENLQVKQEILIAAWLHDVIEDTETDYDEIRAIFGKKVADTVSSLTKETRLAETKRETLYVRQLKKSSFDAKIIKLADVTANIVDLRKSGYPVRKQKALVKNKIRYLDAIRPEIYKKITRVPKITKIIDEMNQVFSDYDIKYVF